MKLTEVIGTTDGILPAPGAMARAMVPFSDQLTRFLANSFCSKIE
jgi:hypothetical protein